MNYRRRVVVVVVVAVDVVVVVVINRARGVAVVVESKIWFNRSPS